jgi:hypothetical protein
VVIRERIRVYGREDRLDELVGQILAKTGSDKRRVRAVTAQLLGSGGGGVLKDPDPRAERVRDLKTVEDYLANKTGTIDEPAAYIHGEIELYKAPFVDVELPLTKVTQSVAYFTGATSRTVLMLAGPLDHMQTRARNDPDSRLVASSLVGEAEVALAIARAWKRTVDEQQPDGGVGEEDDGEGRGWQAGIVETYYRMKNNVLLEPDALEFLARKDEHVPAHTIRPDVWEAWGDDEPKDILVAKPLFVVKRV